MAKSRRPAALAALVLLLASSASGAPDLYIRDTPADTGVEPNPDPGPMWVSQDIWVRKYPDPGYQPYPFPTGSPTWTPLPHEDPEYRDPKFGNPNYAYVRVTNRGTTASTGGEWLKLYWAKASTGLSWPTQWVDYLSAACGGSPKLYGIEITKERENGATADPTERSLYRDAILQAATMSFPSDTVSYWHKQNLIHVQTPMVWPTFPIHGSEAFNPWHREMINRYEVMLQEAKPTVKLLYWNWVEDPGLAPFDYFSPTFMGESGSGSATPVSIGAPFLPALGLPDVTRRKMAGPPPAAADSAILAHVDYPVFRSALEIPNHNPSHVYIGNLLAPTGSMSDPSHAASDPFFFLLHANVDRLWAKWQRDPARLSRLDPDLTYGTASTDADLNRSMAPWNGDTRLDPYTAAGGYIFNKTAKHPSVVFPPIYDDARLQIPALGVGQSVILEIPFFPPNPASFSCFPDAAHVCLLARLVNSETAPHGMTTAEGSSVGANVKANNNIAWKNVTVVDRFPGSALKVSSVLVRNVFASAVATTLELSAAAEIDGTTFFDFGEVRLELQPELYELWQNGGALGEGIEIENGGGQPLLRIAPQARLDNILLPPDAVYSVKVHFALSPAYPAPQGLHPRWDLIQLGAPQNAAEVIGGQRFVLDLDQLWLSPRGAAWRYAATYPGQGWQTAAFGAGSWPEGQAPLGFGDDPATRLDPPPPGTTYFRRTFTVDDPGLVRDLYLRLRADDGAVVYLNGTEVHRANLPQGPVAHPTAATQAVEGIEEEIFAAIPLPPGLLVPGANLIAAEIHRMPAPDDDLIFDLELAANLGQAPIEPAVAFAAELKGAQFQIGQPIPIAIDAFGGAGRNLAIQLEKDGQVLATAAAAPLLHTWTGAALGPHRLKATATDRGVVAEAFATINVLDNLPPRVRMTSPADLASLPQAPAHTFTAEATDPLGAIDRVELYIKAAMNFGAPTLQLGIATTPPYTATATNLAPGHWMVWAVAYDTQGGSATSAPIHVSVAHPHH